MTTERRSYQEYRTNHAARKLARKLGWFSIGLGALELLLPRQLSSVLGVDGRGSFVRLCGVREIITGAGLLLTDNPKPWIQARVAGDVLDLLSLGAAGQRGDSTTAMVAGVGVVGVAALDLKCARDLAQEDEPVTTFDYSDRSGFPETPDKMRGRAATKGSMDNLAQVTGMGAADRETVNRH